MKLIVSAVFSFSLLMPVQSHAVCGDMNGDGIVSASDALTLLRYTVGSIFHITCDDNLISICGDINDDGFITVTDALIVLKLGVGQRVEVRCRFRPTTTTTLPRGPAPQVRMAHPFTCAEVTLKTRGEKYTAKPFGGTPYRVFDKPGDIFGPFLLTTEPASPFDPAYCNQKDLPLATTYKLQRTARGCFYTFSWVPGTPSVVILNDSVTLDCTIEVLELAID